MWRESLREILYQAYELSMIGRSAGPSTATGAVDCRCVDVSIAFSGARRSTDRHQTDRQIGLCGDTLKMRWWIDGMLAGGRAG